MAAAPAQYYEVRQAIEMACGAIGSRGGSTSILAELAATRRAWSKQIFATDVASPGTR